MMVAAIKRILKNYVKSPLNQIFWEFYGKSIQQPKLPQIPSSILFICKGNICRSPFAEKRANYIMQNECTDRYTVLSAGLEVSKRIEPPEAAIIAGDHFGLSLGEHLSQPIDQDMVNAADVVVAMESRHLRILNSRYPGYAGKFFLMPFFELTNTKQYRGYPRYNIEDPYGKNVEEFVKCFNRLDKCLAGLFAMLQFTSKKHQKRPS